MARRLIRILLLAPCILVGGTSALFAQLNWQQFSRSADGLEAGYATYLSYSPRGSGNLVIRYHEDSRITILDGYTSRMVPGPPITPEAPIAFRVYEGVTGQLWTLHPDGVQWYDGSRWRPGKVPEVADEMRSQMSRVARPVPLLPVEHNRVFILLSDRLLTYDALNDHVTVLKSGAEIGLGRLFDLLAATDGGLWITAEQGIAHVPAQPRRLDEITTNSVWVIHRLPPELEVRNLQRPFDEGATGLWMLADERNGTSRVWLQYSRETWTAHPLPRGAIKVAWRTGEGRAWGLEPSRLQQWQPPELDTRSMDDIGVQPWGSSDVAVEPSGAFWVSTREGVWRFATPSWRTPREAPPLSEAVYDILEDASGAVWFLSATHLLRTGDREWASFTLPAPVEPAGVAPRLGTFADGRVCFTIADELVVFDPPHQQFDRVPSPDRLRLLGATPGVNWLVRTAREGGGQSLVRYDGTAWIDPPFPQPPDVIGDWTTVLAAGGGGFWLGGTSGAAQFIDGSWKAYAVGDGAMPAGVLDLFEPGGDTLWAATTAGVLAFNGNSWSALSTGAGRVNRIVRTREGETWLAAESGLWRQFRNQWIALGPEEGVPSSVRVFARTGSGPGRRMWLGHERGLSVFHPEVDAEPPQTYLVDTPAKTAVSGSEMLSFAFMGRDRWKVTAPERLVFFYRIDEGPWQFTPNRRVSFPASSLSAGQHTFQVFAMDRMLNADERNPAAFAFTIVAPWYKVPGLLTIVLLAATAVIAFAALAVNRHLRLVRSYAEIEKIVAERTRQLERANRELAHAEKMRSLGTLAAGVAHEFNSILSIIRGSVQIIETNTDNPEKVQTRISRIKSMIEQGSTLVKAMLGFSRADDSRLVLENVGVVVEDTVRLVGDRLPPEVTVTLDVAGGLPPVHGSRELLQQMLHNLMLNALDAMESRGSLVLHCQRLHQLPEHWVLAPAKAAEYVAVSVEDTGCGISPENLSRVFEPFFTTKAFSTRHGTGLGLSMVYEFCKELGYGLSVRSQLQHGTTFSIVIPALENRSPVATTA